MSYILVKIIARLLIYYLKYRNVVDDTKSWIVRYLLNNNIIDEIDANILDNLVKDSRKSYTDLAKSARVSRPTVKERMSKLEEMGIIQKYTTTFNYDRCGLPVTAFILVGYDTSKVNEASSQKIVARRLSELTFVRKVNIITGIQDFLVEISIDHMNSLADVIIEQIRSIQGVGNTVTMVSFAEFRNGEQIVPIKQT